MSMTPWREGFVRVMARTVVVSCSPRVFGLLLSINLGQSDHFVFKDIREPLDKDQRQDVVFEFRRILLTTDGTGRLPEKTFHGFRVETRTHCWARVRDICSAGFLFAPRSLARRRAGEVDSRECGEFIAEITLEIG